MALEDDIDALRSMPPAKLRDEWQRLHKHPAPPFTPDLLRRGIAYRLQEKAFGGLTPAAKRELARIARQLASGKDNPTLDIKLTPGTRLKRGWQGKVLSVLVVDDGFEFEDRRYGSLTSIAREVTGTNWSGPLFFGLKRRAKPPRKVPANAR